MALDAFLLSKPNLLGKIGLLIYKYHYLRSYPRTLLTVSCVIGTALIICWVVEFLVSKRTLSRKVGGIILLLFFVGSVLLMYKTYSDFTAWSYSHTGRKFRYGAYLLPTLLMLTFGWFMLEIKLMPATSVSDETTGAEQPPTPNANH